MLISPESYYENELKGKSIAHILSEIKNLRREFNAIKREAEGPILCCVSPSYDMQISYTREFLAKANKPAWRNLCGLFVVFVTVFLRLSTVFPTFLKSKNGFHKGIRPALFFIIRR